MRWEEMPKGQTNLAELVGQFDSNCRLEGKPETTCRWYRNILARYLEWADAHTWTAAGGRLDGVLVLPVRLFHPFPDRCEAAQPLTFGL